MVESLEQAVLAPNPSIPALQQLHEHHETVASAKENRLILDGVLTRGYRVSESVNALFAFFVLTKRSLRGEIRLRGRKEVDFR